MTVSGVSAREYNRMWRAAHPEKCAAYTAKYVAKNLKKHRARLKRYGELNRKRISQKVKEWRKANPEKAKSISRRWRTNHPEQCKEIQRNYQKNNRRKIRERQRHKRNTDLQFRLRAVLRCRIYGAIRFQCVKKRNTTIDLIGCSVSFLMGYLEALFKPGMSWKNYGRVWEIDHRTPCVSFDLSIERQQRACFHYQNLQPLFVTENRKKHAKLNWT